MKKVDILAIGVHPDDVELCASGTLIRHAAQGKTFGILDLTKGELGTRGTAEIRLKEAGDAARIMGASFRITLDMPDGLFVYSPENLLKIIRVIRSCRPEIVLCNAPDDRHPDHGRSAKLEADACFYAGLPKIETFDDAGNLQEKWRPRAVYHYIQDINLTPDFVVDISSYRQQKMDSILAYRSQFYDPGSDAPDTPISGKDFMEYVEAKTTVYGRSIQSPAAEGFIFTRTPGVNDLFDLL